MAYFGDYFEPYGWVHPCGAVGQNDLFGYKWAEINEMAEDLLGLAVNFPYLDLIAAVSGWNEISPARYEMLRKDKNAYQYYEEEDFMENIVMGIWLHNGTIEFINPELTAKLYEKYDTLYNDFDRRMFFPSYYSDFTPNAVNRELLRKCLNVYGINDVDRVIKDKIPLGSQHKLYQA